MDLWTGFVDVLYAILSSVSTAFGGNMGLAIAVVSFSVRMALLPWTLRFAYRSLATQAVLKKIAPQLKRIRQQYKNDPQRIWEEAARLHRQHGVKALDGGGFLSILIQAPLFIGLFSAVRRGLARACRFLWIDDLSKPDGILAFFCAVLIGLSTAITPTATDQHKTAMAVLPTILTLVFLWRVAAGVGIYSFASSLVGLAQAYMVRRRAIAMGQ